MLKIYKGIKEMMHPDASAMFSLVVLFIYQILSNFKKNGGWELTALKLFPSAVQNGYLLVLSQFLMFILKD